MSCSRTFLKQFMNSESGNFLYFHIASKSFTGLEVLACGKDAIIILSSHRVMELQESITALWSVHSKEAFALCRVALLFLPTLLHTLCRGARASCFFGRFLRQFIGERLSRQRLEKGSRHSFPLSSRKALLSFSWATTKAWEAFP